MSSPILAIVPTLRSILWSIGFAINAGIFFLPVIRGYLPV